MNEQEWTRKDNKNNNRKKWTTKMDKNGQKWTKWTSMA
jgi:hypothetical protein